MSSLLTNLTWTQRAEVFEKLAEIKRRDGDVRGEETALLNAKTMRHMAEVDGDGAPAPSDT